jgi:hypothetical protein
MMTHIREETPVGSKFVAFFTDRWSGIEVRYLGLRPMAYAYKDRGQLLYTNIESLEQWHDYQQKENEIFSRRKAFTGDEQRAHIVEFARDTGADYIVTNFPFPPEAQSQLNVVATYQNSSYSVLKTYAIPP